MSIAQPNIGVRHTPSRSFWIGVGIIVLAIIAGLAVWSFQRGRLESAVATRRDIIAYVPLQGPVVAPPADRADVFAPYRAPIYKIYASVGQRIRQGDVLMELSFPSAQSDYALAQGELKAARSARDEARRQYMTSVDAAQSRLRSARAAERRARAGASANSAESNSSPPVAGNEQNGNTEANPPATPAAGSQPDAQAALQQALANRVSAEQALTQANTTMEDGMASYNQRLAAAEELLKEAQSGRKQASVRAPIAGEVLAINGQAGQEVGGDRRTPLVTIVDLNALTVQAPLKPDQSTAIHSGTPVKISFQELPNQQFPGTVSSVMTQALPSGGVNYTAVLRFKNEKGLVKPGMHGSASVELGEAKNALVVPNAALSRDSSGRPTVNVLRNGKWSPTVVETGLSDGDYTEIKSGLKEGDTVQITVHAL